MTDYVTFTAAGQLFGLPIEQVQDGFTPTNLTRVPLAGREIAGVLNLRGRIVTMIDLASWLELDISGEADAKMAIGIERALNRLAFWWIMSAKCSACPTAIASRAGQSRPQLGRHSQRGISPRREYPCRA